MKPLLFLLLAVAFAGCSDAPESLDDATLPTDPGPSHPSEPGQGFAPQTGHQETSDARMSLAGDLYAEGCDEMFCIDATATHESGDVYVNNICITPWSESMQQRQSDVQKSEPYAVCQAWGVRQLEQGETLEANFTWDGRLWDDDAQEYRDAPEDSYTWSIHVTYYTQEDGDRQELQIDFPVIIGET